MDVSRSFSSLITSSIFFQPCRYTQSYCFNVLNLVFADDVDKFVSENSKERYYFSKYLIDVDVRFGHIGLVLVLDDTRGLVSRCFQ